MSLAPTRQGILAYKSIYLYPSQALTLPAPFINTAVGSARLKSLIKTGILSDERPGHISSMCIV